MNKATLEIELNGSNVKMTGNMNLKIFEPLIYEMANQFGIDQLLHKLENLSDTVDKKITVTAAKGGNEAILQFEPLLEGDDIFYVFSAVMQAMGHEQISKH